MPTVTGSLSHIGGLEVPAGTNVEVIFTPNKNTTMTDGRLIYTRPVSAYADSTTGYFEATLLRTDRAIETDFHYKMRIRWANPNGYDAGRGHTVVDFPDLKVYVPADGGRIDALARPGAGSAIVWWVSETAPTNSAPNTYWYNPSTGDVQKWS